MGFTLRNRLDTTLWSGAPAAVTSGEDSGDGDSDEESDLIPECYQVLGTNQNSLFRSRDWLSANQ